jgi:protein tyrosine/serine phosphatase
MTLSAKSVQFLRVAVISCVLAYPAQALPKDHAVETGGVVAPRLDIFNFGQISPNYFRGGELKGSAASDLAARGVKLVIDLRSDGDVKATEARLVASAGMKYVRIPMSTRVAPTSEQISEFMSLVTNPANQPVYVHCVHGRDRTGTMVAVYRMVKHKYSNEQAFAEMRSFGFTPEDYPSLAAFVKSYKPAVATPALASGF